MIVLGLSFSDIKLLFADTGSLSVLLSGQICTSRALSSVKLRSQVKLYRVFTFYGLKILNIKNVSLYIINTMQWIEFVNCLIYLIKLFSISVKSGKAQVWILGKRSWFDLFICKMCFFLWTFFYMLFHFYEMYWLLSLSLLLKLNTAWASIYWVYYFQN